MNKQLSNINKMLIQTNKHLGKLQSLRHQFLVGLAKGLGTALGATLVFGLFVAILLNSLELAKDIPIVKDLLEATQIQVITQQLEESQP